MFVGTLRCFSQVASDRWMDSTSSIIIIIGPFDSRSSEKIVSNQSKKVRAAEHSACVNYIVLVL